MSEPMKPMEIEQRSFEIITELLGNRVLDPENELVIKRVIHTTADFDYADNLTFLRPRGAKGYRCAEKRLRHRHRHADGESWHQQDDPGKPRRRGALLHVRPRRRGRRRESRGVTRALVSMEKAAALEKPCIFAIGNAPTALLSLRAADGGGKSCPRAHHRCAGGLCECGG